MSISFNFTLFFDRLKLFECRLFISTSIYTAEVTPNLLRNEQTKLVSF